MYSSTELQYDLSYGRPVDSRGPVLFHIPGNGRTGSLGSGCGIGQRIGSHGGSIIGSVGSGGRGGHGQRVGSGGHGRGVGQNPGIIHAGRPTTQRNVEKSTVSVLGRLHMTIGLQTGMQTRFTGLQTNRHV